MSTATARSKRWTKGPVAIFDLETRGTFHRPGILRGNVGIRHEKDGRPGWYVTHQPSGQGMFSGRTRAVAVALVDALIDRDGADWLDRYASGETRDEDYQAYLRLKEDIHSRGKDAWR